MNKLVLGFLRSFKMNLRCVTAAKIELESQNVMGREALKNTNCVWDFCEGILHAACYGYEYFELAGGLAEDKGRTNNCKYYALSTPRSS